MMPEKSFSSDTTAIQNRAMWNTPTAMLLKSNKIQ